MVYKDFSGKVFQDILKDVSEGFKRVLKSFVLLGFSRYLRRFRCFQSVQRDSEVISVGFWDV